MNSPRALFIFSSTSCGQRELLAPMNTFDLLTAYFALQFSTTDENKKKSTYYRLRSKGNYLAKLSPRVEEGHRGWFIWRLLEGKCWVFIFPVFIIYFQRQIYIEAWVKSSTLVLYTLISFDSLCFSNHCRCSHQRARDTIQRDHEPKSSPPRLFCDAWSIFI